MRVALVALPWSSHARPSAALGALAAWLRRARPGDEVLCASEYVGLSAALGFELYTAIAEDCYQLGEPLYMALRYPERSPAVRERFVDWSGTHLDGGADFGALYDRVSASLSAHLDGVVTRLADRADVVALTTCFGQLFANLTLAQRLKEADPKLRIVLGGSTVSSRVGPSLLAEYPEIDYLVQGEGERPLAALLDFLDGRAPLPERGVLSRGAASPAELWEVAALDELPVPDYDEYAALADEHGIDWMVPVEGSRGCWWDRTKRAGNPKATCYFCNLNVQWSGYREKTVERVVGELDALTERYENTRVYFLDNILRHRGVDELARGIAGLGKHFELFYEMRANVSPREILLLWEAGLTQAQFGIEGLSNGLLRRIGKGTTVLQNLQAMKICQELGVRTGANLIIDFPGATADEVEATRAAILRWAIGFEPCNVTRFHLGVDSTVDTLRKEFGIVAARNHAPARVGLPDAVSRRLQLFDLDFDLAAPPVSWQPVIDAVAEWQRRTREVGEPLLSYRDGGSFLRITDRRAGFDVITLHETHREVYLRCMEIARRDRVIASLPGRESEASDAIDELIEADLVYAEEGRLLALATAPDANAAARRIRLDAPA
jgi:ribosomal peptide maturation radical SAM protein 1